MRFTLTLSLLLAAAAAGQPLRDPDREAALISEHPPQPENITPLIYRYTQPKQAPATTVSAAVERIRSEMRDIAAASMTAAERKQAFNDLYERNARVFKTDSTEQDTGAATTVDEAVEKLELLLYEIAIDVSPDQKTREDVIEGAPARLRLEPVRPILIAPRENRQKIVVTREAEEKGSITPWWRTRQATTARPPVKQITKPSAAKPEPEPTATEAPVQVAVLADEKATVSMHDDTTILRTVKADDGGLVLFDALHLWAGAAFQYDGYSFDELLNASGGGDRNDSTAIRRAEVTIRSTFYDYGELKLQYDVEANIWRDLYYRTADESRNFTVTVGNQTEPMSQENNLGNKFTMAMENSAPTSAFGVHRGMGIRLNKWFNRSVEDQWLPLEGYGTGNVTAGVGLFGRGIEDSDTDLALTGRLTIGRQYLGGESGVHLGVSATLRDGQFNRIAPRPGIYEAPRIRLASFDADQAAIVGFEGLFTQGSLHASTEFYLADYRGGDSNARGFGGYAEVGYYLTGQQRLYRPRWGLWAPLSVGANNVFEVFGRISYTYGDSDTGSANALGLVTVGGSWYRHKFRASINGFYGETDRDILAEDAGVGVTARLQYLL